MARKKMRGSGLGNISLVELGAELQRRRGELPDLQQRHDELLEELEQIRAVIATLGGSSGPRVGRPRGSASASSGAGGPRKKKVARGQGWATIEAAMKANNGNGTSASLKETWASLGSKTPLSVALASFVKSGRLKRKGEGRATVYSLA